MLLLNLQIQPIAKSAKIRLTLNLQRDNESAITDKKIFKIPSFFIE